MSSTNTGTGGVRPSTASSWSATIVHTPNNDSRAEVGTEPQSHITAIIPSSANDSHAEVGTEPQSPFAAYGQIESNLSYQPPRTTTSTIPMSYANTGLGGVCK